MIRSSDTLDDPTARPDADLAREYLEPIHDNVLVKRLEADEKTKGGIVLPGTAKTMTWRGEVIGVGRGRTLDSGKEIRTQVKKGDVVLLYSYTNTQAKVDGEEYIACREADIIGIVRKVPA